MMPCAVATSSAARAGAARLSRRAASRTKARMEGSVLLAMINRSEVITARKHLQMPLPSLSHSPQILPGLGIAQRCRLLEPLPGDFDVAANAIAFIVDDAEVVHAGGVAERNALL